MGTGRWVVGAVLLAQLLVACAGSEAAEQQPLQQQPAAGSEGPDRPPRSDRRGPPNIVLFLTDDQTLAELAVMPRTAALIGDRGTTFTQAISQYPLCCPARGSLLTGQLPHNHGAMGNAPPWGGWSMFDDSETLPIWLQRAGYRTGIVGKYLNGYPVEGEETHVVPGWDEWRVPVAGAYDYRNYLVNENGTLVPHSQYQSSYVAETTSAIIEDFSATGDPFFVWSGFLAPHDGTPIEPGDPVIDRDEPGVSRTPAVQARYRDTEQGELPDKPSLLEADDSDKNSFIRLERPFTHAHVTEQSRQRRESLRSVDDAVGAVVRTLRRTGELRDTVLVFASDNGYLLGEHGLNQKIFGYEESIRVPLLMAGPGIPAGETRDQLVGLVDLPTTLLDLAGVRPGLEPDGISLLPMLRDPSVGRGRHLLLEAGGWPFRVEERLYTGIRTSDGRVVLRYWDGWVETYDLATDPYQLDGTTSPAEFRWRADLLAELDALEGCAGEECSVG